MVFSMKILVRYQETKISNCEFIIEAHSIGHAQQILKENSRSHMIYKKIDSIETNPFSFGEPILFKGLSTDFDECKWGQI